MEPVWRVEFHCHTRYSKDSLTPPQKLVEACRKKNLDRVVITDHDTIQGAREAQKIDPELVIVGEEILTQEGELLAAFVKDEIPPLLSAEETIRRLRDQEAFISVSHPFDRLRKGHWQPDDLERIVPQVDAIEVFNARCLMIHHNQLAAEFAQEHQLPGTAGSDAHTIFELGKVSMLLPPFKDRAGLKNSLEQASIQGSLSAPWVHFSSRFAVWYKQIFR
jgi:predicted metal-dependent phosphoesterase TrpH